MNPRDETDAKRMKMGVALAAVGVAVAAINLLPPFQGALIPIWLMAGMLVYLPGSFLVMTVRQHPDKWNQMMRLRYIRMAFAVVFLANIVLVFRNS